VYSIMGDSEDAKLLAADFEARKKLEEAKKKEL
jgi:hypothetical protein